MRQAHGDVTENAKCAGRIAESARIAIPGTFFTNRRGVHRVDIPEDRYLPASTRHIPAAEYHEKP
jgi:hypothetical protein